MKRAVLVLLVACGTEAPTFDPGDAAMPACTAQWSGNFIERAITADPCAMLTGTTLVLAVPSATIGSPLAVTIELGTATAGTYTAPAVSAWSAQATRMIDHSRCELVAGTRVVPHGAFTLELTSTVPPHGTIGLDLAVLAIVFSACGDPPSAHVEVTF